MFGLTEFWSLSIDHYRKQCWERHCVWTAEVFHFKIGLSDESSFTLSSVWNSNFQEKRSLPHRPFLKMTGILQMSISCLSLPLPTYCSKSKSGICLVFKSVCVIINWNGKCLKSISSSNCHSRNLKLFWKVEYLILNKSMGTDFPKFEYPDFKNSVNKSRSVFWSFDPYRISLKSNIKILLPCFCCWLNIQATWFFVEFSQNCLNLGWFKTSLTLIVQEQRCKQAHSAALDRTDQFSECARREAGWLFSVQCPLILGDCQVSCPILSRFLWMVEGKRLFRYCTDWMYRHAAWEWEIWPMANK